MPVYKTRQEKRWRRENLTVSGGAGHYGDITAGGCRWRWRSHLLFDIQPASAGSVTLGITLTTIAFHCFQLPTRFHLAIILGLHWAWGAPSKCRGCGRGCGCRGVAEVQGGAADAEAAGVGEVPGGVHQLADPRWRTLDVECQCTAVIHGAAS